MAENRWQDAMDDRLRAADPLHEDDLPAAEHTEASLARLLVKTRGLTQERRFPRWRTPHRFVRLRPRLALGTAAVAAMACVALGLVLGSAATPPAFAVTRHSDGTVTVRIMRLTGIPGANRRLAKLGVPVRLVRAVTMARYVSKLHVCQGPPSGTVHTITVNPAAIPRRGLLLVGVNRSVHVARLANVRLSPAASRTVRRRVRALARRLKALRSATAAARLGSIRPETVDVAHRLRIHCAQAVLPPAG